jgi:MFS family permease
VVTLIPTTMTADLGIGLNQFQKATPIITGFLLGYVAGMPLLGGLSDRLGRRLVLQLCLGGFLVGSGITAASLNIAAWLQMSDQALWILVTGRALQGIAGGALLPVTMALVADLWAEAQRPAILGTVGAAQELGSVVGPLYGAWLAALIGWKGVFWVNIPLTLLAMTAVHFALPGRSAAIHGLSRRKVDVVGGLLLAVALGLMTIGLNTSDPDKAVLPPNGPLFIGSGVGVLALFVVWEWLAKTKLVDLSGARKAPFFAVIGASFIAGAALLVTLFDIVLFAEGVLLMNNVTESAKLLVKFLIALPVGAVVGGLLARRFGVRVVAVGGFALASSAYWLVSTWPASIMSEHYQVLGVALPRFDTDLAVAGFGLGLVIAPLSAAVLHIVPADQHGVASAGVVVARTMGMLIGFAGLTSWGLYRFHVLVLQRWVPPVGPWNQDDFTRYGDTTKAALLDEYHEIFSATSVLCLIAAAISLGVITRRSEEQIAAENAPAVA